MSIVGKRVSAAALAGLAAGAVTLGSPVAADPGTDGTAADTADVVVRTWSGMDHYVDRRTTQELGEKLRAWDKSSELPALAGSALLCSRLRVLPLTALCTFGLTAVNALVLDKVRQADEIGGCLRLSVRFGIPSAAAYNDDGEYCRGARR
ncbi:hypothetical protein Ade02nite_79040 [Paractinoplanes deccanensis]|uniref:Uncharacterized protein n=1 Tax=Paractinoplanes deccanensis TaxID=113561 RepID=A0ABQ3YGW9_9ACTN|nr:hypothetical protein [Actinoplanes deccanensis]GID79263.1 hypothetical protein Ade02nite_79040 [Actinoplanes deccanensis]